VRGARRQTGWEEGVGGGAHTTVTGSTEGFLGSAAISLVDGLTLVRIRGMIQLTLTSAVGLLSGFRGAYGIGIASSEAIGVGTSAIKIPVADADWDGWMWHHFFNVIAFSSAADGLVRQTIPIDCKAMRKFPAGDALYLAWEMAEIGTAELTHQADTRVLAKLP